MLALRAVGSSLAQVYAHVTMSLLANVIAVFLSLPVLFVIAVLALSTRSLGIFPLGIALFLGILPNPALCGVQHVARALAQDDLVRLSDAWGGFRAYWQPTLVIWLLAAPISLVIFFNIVFYARLAGAGSGPGLIWVVLIVIWLNLLLFWFALHLYVFPLLQEQEVKRLFLIYRNAALIVVARPVATVMISTFWLALLVLTSFTGFVAMFGLTLGALIQQNACRRILATFQESHRPH
jgi:uncharacterized membrane protein YesL